MDTRVGQALGHSALTGVVAFAEDFGGNYGVSRDEETGQIEVNKRKAVFGVAKTVANPASTVRVGNQLRKAAKAGLKSGRETAIDAGRQMAAEAWQNRR